RVPGGARLPARASRRRRDRVREVPVAGADGVQLGTGLVRRGRGEQRLARVVERGGGRLGGQVLLRGDVAAARPAGGPAPAGRGAAPRRPPRGGPLRGRRRGGGRRGRGRGARRRGAGGRGGALRRRRRGTGDVHALRVHHGAGHVPAVLHVGDDGAAEAGR